MVCRMTQEKRPPAKPGWEDVPPRDWVEREAHRVAMTIREMRKPRSAQWLADRTAELEYPMNRALIADLELGRRRYITTAEIIVIAAALETAPVALLYPPPYNEEIDYLPGQRMTRFDAAQRFSGIYDRERDTVSAPYWLNTDRLYSEREVRDRRNRARNMFEIATRSGDTDLAKQAARQLAELESPDDGG